eukprot:TRINITY_DN10390_c0_g1_i1.p2 TRINITY_DN10390_c0_g1~~TRINITY_DN10390_c0_g1_i1.p2  ORF type:complete len:180 (+),score=35.86 TRINITY_DN10390_c0_g1_i1:142-681(+)
MICLQQVQKSDQSNFHSSIRFAAVFEAVIDRTGVAPGDIEDIVVGNVLADQAALMARIAQLLSNIPETTPVTTVNRQCSSGLQAVAHIANAITAGQIDIGLAAGVESMSSKNMTEVNVTINPRVFEHPTAAECLTPMGITSENVAAQFGITRQQQDAFALESQRCTTCVADMNRSRLCS